MVKIKTYKKTTDRLICGMTIAFEHNGDLEVKLIDSVGINDVLVEVDEKPFQLKKSDIIAIGDINGYYRINNHQGNYTKIKDTFLNNKFVKNGK